MGWRDELLEASLGTAKFKVAGADVEAGRQFAVHKFGGSNVRPFVEDLGVGGEKFTIDAYVLGPNYLEDRRKLLDVATRPGQALRLTLPSWTPRIVFCTGVRVRESSDENGFARFELSFIVTDDQVTLAKVVRPARDSETWAKKLETTARASAETNLKLEGVPDNVREGAAESLRAAGRALLALDFTAGPSAIVSDVTLAARRLIEDAAELATAPADLIAQVVVAVENVAGAVGNAAGSIEAYRALFDLEIPALFGTSANGVARDRNAAAVVSLVRQYALAGYTRAALENRWETRQDAELARARALEAIDVEAETSDDDAYGALVALRSSLTASLPPEDQDLPDLVRLRLVGDTTTLAIAYRLYDDVARDDEIRARNNLRNPARVSAGSALEVLSK